MITGSPGAVIVLASSVAEGYGGVQTFNQLVLNALREAGLVRTIIAMSDPPEAAWTAEVPGSHCAAGGSRLRFVRGAIAKATRVRHPLIVVNHIGLTSVGRALKHLTGGRLVVFLLGVEAWAPWPRRTRWGLERCDRLVAISKFTLARFRERHARFACIPAEVCYLAARPLDGAGVSDVGRDKDSEAIRVLIVGRLWGRGLLKGQREILTIWPEIVSEFPSAELWIAGNGEGRSDLEKLAQTLGVTRCVRFTGGVSDRELACLYARSDVFAMPSRGEGFGLVFAEAMAHGLPCIASSRDAGSEVVVHGETGLIVDPENLQDLKCALRQLLADASLRTRLGEAGRRRASELFSIEGFNRRIQNLLTAPEMWTPLSTS